MAQPKKFGAFSGVFTPSILTILGVIMYMRLGWVVGEAGMIGAIAIILISHVISITTGLSISSIATDKRIKTGGIYYILSRSLGLPMGGAIGLALYIGTALSISLYIVGFVESVLSFPAISDFLGMEGTTNDFRILGTGVIIFLVILAFISTSLAIKTQFLILAFIVLSLVSIVVGFFIHQGMTPEKVLLFPAKEGVPLEYVFSIFFPAVTGFTAGVAMSGDLKDPKKNIPAGTIAAIAVGLVVYLALAIGLGLTVNREILIKDSSFLNDLAWIMPLVIMGIWGATLSSALGGILGAPRILQAIAVDKITPRFLGKGYGASNEPRNALIFTFIISELGILIGDLNAIAGVVSMFYLASYGFINLAFWLERVASTDFRPSFKIPAWVGTIGFIASFAVMFKLNLLSMLVAFILMGGIYFFLKRKELKLDFGDVWQSVWSTVIRNALYRIDRQEIEDRNWQPNIILFSGGSKYRSYLIDFGRFLVGRHGIMSNFDLHENSGAEYLFPKHKQSIPDPNEKNKGVFTRRQTVSDLYAGIEAISATYGFSGVEPNTVLMGWARHTKAPQRFVQMIRRLVELDLNILLLDYDSRYGFGNKKLIDIWWRGAGNNGNLALTLAKFIHSSPQWQDSTIRLLIVTYDNAENVSIRKNAEQIFDNLRITAEVKIINNQVEKKPFYEIIRTESINTDITFLGIPPEIPEGKEENFVQKTNQLMLDVGTVILIQASTLFKNMNFGSALELTQMKKLDLSRINLLVKEEYEAPEIEYPKDNVLADAITTLINNLNDINYTFHQEHFINLLKFNTNFLASLKEEIDTLFEQSVPKVHKKKTIHAAQNFLSDLQTKFLLRSQKLFEQIKREDLEKQFDLLQAGNRLFLDELENTLKNLPETLSVYYQKSDLQKVTAGSSALRRYSRGQMQLMAITGRPVRYRVKFGQLVRSYFPNQSYHYYYHLLEKWGLASLQFLIETDKFIRSVRDNLLHLETLAARKELTTEDIAAERKKIMANFEQLTDLLAQSQQAIFNNLLKETTQNVQYISNNLREVHPNRYIIPGKILRKKRREREADIQQAPAQWLRNQKLLFNASELELLLMLFETKLMKVFRNINNEIQQQFDLLIKNRTNLKQYIEKYAQNMHSEEAIFAPPETILNEDIEPVTQAIETAIQTAFKIVKSNISKFPENISLISEESLNNFTENQYISIEEVQISAARLLDYLIQDKFIEPLQNQIQDIPARLKRHSAAMQEAIRLISFTLQPSDKSETVLSEVFNRQQFLEQQVQKINVQAEELERFGTELQLRINERLNTTLDALSFYAFTKTAENLRQYIKEKESKQRFSMFRNTAGQIRSFFRYQYDQLWYRQSKAVLLAQRMAASDTHSHSIVSDFLGFLDESSPSSGIVNKLPFYYQQLFLRKYNYYTEFWQGRTDELEAARKAINRFKEGYNGGVMIVGEQNSGKTFFSHYMAKQFITNANIIVINPPEGGSISTVVFKDSFERATGQKGNYEHIFSQLDANTVLIFNDIEMWWEKSEKGCMVIHQIVALLEKYSSKLLFVVNLNIHSCRFINKIYPISNYFLDVIELMPFNAEELKEIITTRHQSSGMKLKMGKKEEGQFRAADYASLFAKYFTCSKGNVGLALSLWVANIVDVSGDWLEIQAPKTPDMAFLESLTTDIKLIIVQFVLHKQINFERLQRITLQNKEPLNKKTEFMKRAGILIEKGDEVYELNPALYIFLKQKLIENEML